MVFQSYAIWPHMTVFDNVAFGFRVRGVRRAAARAAVERALSLVDLAGFADRPATRLSGGQQQRVALARALACDAKVVLLDEPLSNLDAQLRIAMRDELAELRRRLGFTAIYVTHDQEEAFALSDRIIVMRAGRIEQQGTPSEIHDAPRTRFVARFLGMKNILAAEIAAVGDRAGRGAARAGYRAARARPLAEWHGPGFRRHRLSTGRCHRWRAGRRRHRGRDHARRSISATWRTIPSGPVRSRSPPTTVRAPSSPRAAEVRWRVPPECCLLLRE